MMSLFESFRRGLAPEPVIPLSDWADQHRILPSSSAMPGRWRTSVVPYMREVLDALTPNNGVEKVVVMAAAQTSKTELILNLIAYIVANAGGPCLVVQPSLDMAARFVRGRVDPMIEAIPMLAARVGGVGSKKTSNTLRRKSFQGGEIVFAGSNSAASLRSMPARFVLLDEVDSFDRDLEGEGDPVALSEARAVTYGPRKKILAVSTPTISGASRIEQAFLETDQRRYYVSCPHCGHRFELTFDLLAWPEGNRRAAYVVCPGAGCVIEERNKHAMVAAGMWVPMAAGDGRTAGFAIGGMISPFVRWGDLAAEHELVASDPARLKTFTNVKLGISWDETASAALDAARLAERAEEFGAELDDKIAVVTAGLDFQDTWAVMQVVGWARGEEAFILAEHRFHGDPSSAQFWADIDRTLSQGVRLPGGEHRPIMAACLDTGGPLGAKVLEFSATRFRRRVFAIKGAAKAGSQPWPRKATRSKKGGWPLFVCGVTSIKEIVYPRLPKEAGEGAIHFSAELPATFYEEMTAERPITRYVHGRPVREWIKTHHGARNESFDCFAYSYLALTSLRVSGMDLDRMADELAHRSEAPQAPRSRVSYSKFMAA